MMCSMQGCSSLLDLSELKILARNQRFDSEIVSRKFFPFSVRVALVAEPTAYIGTDDYTSMDTYLNKTVYARSLPPIPENCPLPMGVVGEFCNGVYLFRAIFLVRRLKARYDTVFHHFGRINQFTCCSRMRPIMRV